MKTPIEFSQKLTFFAEGPKQIAKVTVDLQRMASNFPRNVLTASAIGSEPALGLLVTLADSVKEKLDSSNATVRETEAIQISVALIGALYDQIEKAFGPNTVDAALHVMELSDAISDGAVVILSDGTLPGDPSLN